MQEKLLTRKEVMDIFDVTKQTLIHWEKEGILHPIKISPRTVRYLKKEIDNLINPKGEEK